MQVEISRSEKIVKKGKSKRRSECPLNASVEMLGDRWSLLIIRDMMLRGWQTFKEFLEGYESIATNILADRLRKLVANGILTAEPDPSDGRRLIYSLTAKGIALAPVLTEMVLWAAAHEDTGNQALVRQMRKDKQKFMAEVRERWALAHSNQK
ncbi:MAG: helix-turn-helix transcriptional regulator [Acidobacteriia bacterium]|nr:helix-turn-helix transcriptional regulator [Terriglobia bacterium]